MQVLTVAHSAQTGLQPRITAKAEREGGFRVALYNFSHGGKHVL